MPQTIYLAGPDVFHPTAVQLGHAKKAMCREFGFEGLYPFDNELPPDMKDASGAICAANIAMIQKADCGILNLTPFRGPSADVGTVFELGVLIGLGKPVFGYSNDAGDLIDRVRLDLADKADPNPGLVLDLQTNLWRDPDGMSVEDFKNSDNLMLDASFAKQGRKIHRQTVRPSDRYTALDGFRACLAEARAYFAAREAARAA